MRRRTLLAGGLAGMAARPRAWAQPAYPDRPIRVIVSFAAGGPTDIVMRKLAEKMAPLLGQPIVVENRTGASGTIGSAEAARARPDGYTLLVAVSSSHSIAANLMRQPGFHPVNDFAGVGVICVVPICIGVNPLVPAQTLAELVALVKREPGRYSFSTSGTGGVAHLAAELFMRQAGGLRMNHIPYRGAGPGLQDVMAGHVPIYIDSAGNAVDAHRSGRLRLLAQFVERRVSALADVPTALESGIPEMIAYTYNAILTPAHTPARPIAALHGAMRRVIADTDFREFLRTVAAEPLDSTPESTLTFVKSEYEKWQPIIRDAGLTIE
ncbi:Bug family tripartite tricarboxylate transporter substrate binding protein [Dankookia rubra]|nr:tripartite tricarboxylate transporter substrate binding protein [Dankookia rubra]